MILYYYSNWIVIFFVLYLLTKSKYINPGITVYILTLGNILYFLLNIYNDVDFDLDFFIIGIILHVVPLIVFKQYNYESNKYSFKFFIITFLLYNIYLSFMDKSILDVYLLDKQPTSIKEFIKKYIKL